MCSMQVAFGDEPFEDLQAGGRIDLPEAASLRNRQTQSWHLFVLTPNSNHEAIVKSHACDLIIRSIASFDREK